MDVGRFVYRWRQWRWTSLRFAWCYGLLLCGRGIAFCQHGLSLHEAIQRAEAGPVARITQARVDEARAAVRQAGLAPNTRLYLSSEDLRPWDDNFSFANQTEDYAYLAQVFETDGKRGKRTAVAQARQRQAQAERALQLRQLAIRVATAYWNAESMLRIADLLRDDMRAVDEMVRYHQERVDAGATRGVDLLRMQIERDRLAVSLAVAQRDAKQANLQLFREIGQEPSDAALTDRLEDTVNFTPLSLSTVLEQRPDVQSAREAVRVAEADVKLQRANGLPDPDVFAGYKRNGGADTAYAAIQIPLPFRNRNQGEVERARASIEGAKAALSLLESQIGIEITQAQDSYEAQQRIVKETLPDMRERAKRNLDITAAAYRLGGVDLLRFIDAERTEFDVEVSAVRTLAQLQSSAVQLQLTYGIHP